MPMSGIPPTGPTSLMLILVGFPATGQAVTAITVTQPAGASATFAKIGQHSGGGRMLELWLGYACVGSPTNLSIAWTGAGNIMVQIIVIAADADCAILPTVATANNAGTSTSDNSGTITPAVGEIVVATAVWANSSNSSARTSAGNTFVWNNERTGSATCMGMAFCSAAAAAASQLTWTITSAAWIGLIARLTMPAPAAGVPAFVYKGRDSSTQDAGDVA
jgi:hypothetical protein